MRRRARSHEIFLYSFLQTQKKSLKRPIILSFIKILLFLIIGSGTFLPFVSNHSVVHADTIRNAVTTYKNDINRSGQYDKETILNTSTVSSSRFGKRVAYPVDGQVYAQPLYMPNLTIHGSSHNTVFAATEHDSVYAFDADQTQRSAALWHTSFLSSGVTSVPSRVVSCYDVAPENGITGTPAIDRRTNTMYVVSYTEVNGSQLVYQLHALDLTTGADKPGSPVTIQGSVSGTGAGSTNGTIQFNPFYQRQRGSVLLANGQIYIAFGAFCDGPPYHGWIFGYTYSGSAFQQADLYNDTVNGADGGIWNNLSADNTGNIYFVSGNGDVDLNTGGKNAGDTFGKLNAHLQLQDYFTPFNASCLAAADADLGSGSPLILPSLHEQIAGGKEGRIYVVNNNTMGKFTSDPTLNCTSSEHLRTDLDQVVQEFPPTTVGGVYSTPALWNGPNSQFVYITESGGSTRAFQLTNGHLSATPTSQTPESFGFPGGDAIVSSNGTTGCTGIVWMIDPKAVLRAYDASNVSTELYNSTQNVGRDGLDTYVKFSTPVVANGEVFVGTKDTLTIYGPLIRHWSGSR